MVETFDLEAHAHPFQVGEDFCAASDPGLFAVSAALCTAARLQHIGDKSRVKNQRGKAPGKIRARLGSAVIGFLADNQIFHASSDPYNELPVREEG